MAVVRGLCAVVLCGVSLVAREARAGVRLDVVRGEGAGSCADGVALQRALVARLGARAFEGDATERIEVMLTRVDTRWSARVRLRDAQNALVAARDLASEASTCEALGEALTLTLSLLIDPLAPAAPDLPSAPAPVVTPTVAVAVRSASRPSARRGAAQVTGEAVVLWGVVPGVAPGASLRAELSVSRRWRMALAVTALPATAVSAGASRFAFGWTAASAGVCLRAVDGRVGVDLCGAVIAGALHVSVDGAAAHNTGDRAWLSAEVTPRLRARLAGPLVFTAGVGVGVAITRDVFGVTGATEAVYAVSPVSLGASVGVGAEVP